MLLTVSAPPAPTEGKQVAASSTTVNEVLYVVPAGKTFVGIATGTNGSSAMIINGARLYLDTLSTGATSTPVPMTLLAGTVVKNGNSTGVSLIGVEQ